MNNYGKLKQCPCIQEHKTQNFFDSCDNQIEKEDVACDRCKKECEYDGKFRETAYE